ncbi:hypothetical protein [Tepidibacillus sp. LV47]|uniref:hypothetical protein n=1 Tax=Tepidibacillus sp. LV47 TaxID=3398228 RepID=UPI003AACEEB9
MVVTINSNVPYLQHLKGDHYLEQPLTVKNWLEGLGVKWDVDTLVILNGKVCKGNELLQDQDRIHLLIPLSGG